MGYTTEFKGVLHFTSELKASQLAYLGTILGEDRRDHPEWNASEEFYYIDLELTADFAGLKWNGAEKSYGMVDQVKAILRLMSDKYLDFGLSGKLSAQGEERSDTWVLLVDGDSVIRQEIVIEGLVKCPDCGASFVPGETE